MLLTTTLINTLILSISATALPFKRATTITAADIIAVDSNTSTCTNAPAAGECRTASQAAPYIAISFTNFAITSFGEQAALVADMLYESGSFKYAINHYPGVPGQGTRIMMSPTYVAKYADYLSTECANCGISAAQVVTATAKGPAALLELVNTDEWSFGAAAWFLTTQCSESVRQGLAAGTQAGWATFLSECLGATGELEARNQIWQGVIDLKAR